MTKIKNVKNVFTSRPMFLAAGSLFMHKNATALMTLGFRGWPIEPCILSNVDHTHNQDAVEPGRLRPQLLQLRAVHRSVNQAFCCSATDRSRD